MNPRDYSNSYSDKSFWNKIKHIPENTGCSVLRAAYTLYVLLKAPSVPLWAKTAIIGALGYFIVPIDVIPDFPIGIGYVDDVALMTLILGQLYAFINKDIRDQVEAMLPERCRCRIFPEMPCKSE